MQNSVIFCILEPMSKLEFIIGKIVVNGKSIRRVVVDPHIRKHGDITDDLLLDLVRLLDDTDNLPVEEKDGFSYFVNLLVARGKQYRLVWLLEEDQLYIGVITAYRDERRKK